MPERPASAAQAALPALDEPAPDPREHEALLQFLYSAPIGLLQARIDGEVLLVNPVSSQLLMPLAAAGGLDNLYDTFESVAPDLRQRVQDFEPDHGLICQDLLVPVYVGPTQRRAARVLSLTLLKLDGQRLMVVLGDVTDTLRRERELRDTQAWTQAIAGCLSEYALLRLDGDGCVIDWNPGVGRLTGHDARLVGQNHAVLHAPDSLSARMAGVRLRDADACGWSLDEGWLQRADGSRFWGSCLLAPLPPGPGETGAGEGSRPRGYSLVVRDISERRDATQELLKAVSRDHLTGLANRRAFFETGERELRLWAQARQPLALLMIDADHFKRINDAHGHAAGDAVLRHLAAGLNTGARALDLIARIGGEEFAVLLPGVDGRAALALAERLCRVVAAQTVIVGGKQIRCTVSIGVATMDEAAEGLQGLLCRADAALYEAKHRGRDCAVAWTPALDVPLPPAAQA